MDSPITAFSMKMVYGTMAYEGVFIRNDGTTVELNDGLGTMEHYKNVVPDYRYIGPIFLILLVLSWGCTILAGRMERKQSTTAVLAWIGIGMLSVLWLYGWWLL